MKHWLWTLISVVLPPVALWRASRVINREKTVSEYENQLRNAVEEFSGDWDELAATAENAYRSELDRNTHLDSKAGNYLGNVGVVLSILSLAPILSVALGINQSDLVPGSLPEAAVLLLFGYAVGALLLSAYYSSKALKMRGYSVHFTADAMKNRIGGDDPDSEDKIVDLLVCKKRNELHNLEKNNAISVAESLTRNGLIGLGTGIGLVIVISLFL